ncbi:cation:proton antiporter [Palleronia sp. KMU-117]|uniref:cation:proton antiporter n=1 Tax=Palleronia sp. KMU-117 TaxID=3434108 RepID=UPI003D716D33
MAIEASSVISGTIPAIALVGALGVGSQWLAWRFQLPAIVLMLAAGIVVGPVTGILDPAAEFGSLLAPLIAVAVAIILFEGGLTLDFKKLGDAGRGVLRLVVIGAPLGWLLSALALRYGAGLTWESSVVFGGIMIVTGPTVIAPLLRQARLQRRPAALLQWEAIVNDPIGAMAAVIAFQVVLALRGVDEVGFGAMVFGIAFAALLGYAAARAIVWMFRDALVPEYMKVPVLFAAVLSAFALADIVLHESGLLAVTVMGLVIANANLPSYEELRRFKEHATVLLVSGLFILLAASLDFSALAQLTWRSALFVLAVVLLVRPLTVFASFIGTDLPWRERALVAFTGPRGIVLIAVAGLFGERLAAAGVPDGALVAPLAFALVVGTVVLHGFSLTPMARALGVSGGESPGVLLVGGSRFTTGLGESLQNAGIPVLVTDPNRTNLRRARSAGIPTFYGDILGEAAEHSVEFLEYRTVLAATDNDAYNTLVVADLGPEFGRDEVWRLARPTDNRSRHALPPSLSGRVIGGGRTFEHLEGLMSEGWTVRLTRMTDEFDFEMWRERVPDALLLGVLLPTGEVTFLPEAPKAGLPENSRAISIAPPET